jgi:hypothetical protein
MNVFGMAVGFEPGQKAANAAFASAMLESAAP